MLYRVRSKFNTAALDRKLKGILNTPPVATTDVPVCVVSIVTANFIPMFLCSLKSFLPKLGGAKVAALIDRGMSDEAKATLRHHVPGIELVVQDDIATGSVQRGGCWERLLYCLTRAETDYTIQLDGDILTLGPDINEVVACVRANRAFAIADGFEKQSLPEAAAMAQATPSKYIGIKVEREFARYPGAEELHYVRGSAGFAGFARGGFPRARIVAFHEEMERLLGKAAWRTWGTEQCASNFAIANSPGSVVLPYPEYASFTPRVQRQYAKLFHFIGAFRYMDGYYGKRAQEVIAAATPGAAPLRPPPPTGNTAVLPGPLPLVRSLTRESIPRYVSWGITGRRGRVQVQPRPRREFRSDRPPGPVLELAAEDVRTARSIYADALLLPPVWIPPERVQRIVELAPGNGLSCAWWLSQYWRATLEAFQPDADSAARIRSLVGANRFADRFTLQQCRADADLLRGERIDILSLGNGTPEESLLARVDAAVIVGSRAASAPLPALGFRVFPGNEDLVWAYRASPWGPFSPPRPALSAATEPVLPG